MFEIVGEIQHESSFSCHISIGYHFLGATHGDYYAIISLIQCNKVSALCIIIFHWFVFRTMKNISIVIDGLGVEH